MSKIFEGSESVKIVAGGAKTAEELADMFEAHAEYIREMIKDGVKFDLTDIGSGHMCYSTEDPKIGAKYYMDSVETDENGHVIIRAADGQILDEFDEKDFQ